MQILFTALADCGTPEVPTNGMINFSSTILGSIVTYKCNEGCTLDGAVQRICEHSSQWSGNMPQCYGELRNHYIVKLYNITNNYILMLCNQYLHCCMSGSNALINNLIM